MNRYLTPGELEILYPQSAEFTSQQVDAALKQSVSLVDSFLDTKLTPLVSKRFTEAGQDYPGILKMCQVNFARYVCEMINNGWTEELQLLYDNTANVLQKVTANELNIPDYNVKESDVGWRVVHIETSGPGFCEVRGSAPTVTQMHTITFITPTTYSIYRDDGTTLVASATVNYAWKSPFTGVTFPSTDSYGDTFEIRFSGSWTTGNRIYIKGTPPEAANTAPSQDSISSGNIIYW